MLKEFHDITEECLSNRNIQGCVFEVADRLEDFISRTRSEDQVPHTIRVHFEPIYAKGDTE